MRQRRLLLAAGASLATVVPMGTALADPVPPPPPYPPVVIVGAEVTQELGRVLTNQKQLITYSAGQWLAQVFKAVPDIHGASILGSINGISPGILNDSSFAALTVQRHQKLRCPGSGTHP